MEEGGGGVRTLSLLLSKVHAVHRPSGGANQILTSGVCSWLLSGACHHVSPVHGHLSLSQSIKKCLPLQTDQIYFQGDEWEGRNHCTGP